MNRLAVCLVLVSATALLAAEAPKITISKSDTIAVAIAPIQGSDAAAITQVLQSDLALAGVFSIGSAQNAAFTIGGVSSGSTLQGKVTDHNGGVVVGRTYNGSARGKIHEFVDDIVQTLTGAKGIANSKVAFVSTRSGRKEIYLADYDGANVQQLTRDNNISVSPKLSADGRQLLYTGYKSGYADVYRISLGNGARERIIKFPGTNSGAVFSPDSSRIAVTLSKDGNPELYVTGANGDGPHRLTHTPGVESSPAWSPNGSELIYSSDDQGGPQLYRTSTGFGGAHRISTGHNYCTEPDWSPDGKAVAFNIREGGSFQIATMNLSAGSARVLSAGERPAWGPDSRHLMYAQGGALYIIDSQTGKKSKVLDGLGQITEPTWSR